MRETDKSYGVISFSRTVTGKGESLFGSSVKCNNPLTLRISHAAIDREGSEEDIVRKETIMEVKLTPGQYAELISGIGYGTGVPCTIFYAEGETITDCPYTPNADAFREDYHKSYQSAQHDVDDMLSKVSNVLSSPTVKKSDIKELGKLLHHLKLQLQNNMPFITEEFDAYLDKAVSNAKMEIDTFFQTQIQQKGLQALSGTDQKLNLLITNEESEDSTES